MDQLAEAFRDRIFPLLQEYFFDDWAKIRAVLANNAFVSMRNVPKVRERLTDFVDEERKLYERLPDDRSCVARAPQSTSGFTNPTTRMSTDDDS